MFRIVDQDRSVFHVCCLLMVLTCFFFLPLFLCSDFSCLSVFGFEIYLLRSSDYDT